MKKSTEIDAFQKLLGRIREYQDIIKHQDGSSNIEKEIQGFIFDVRNFMVQTSNFDKQCQSLFMDIPPIESKVKKPTWGQFFSMLLQKLKNKFSKSDYAQYSQKWRDLALKILRKIVKLLKISFEKMIVPINQSYDLFEKLSRNRRMLERCIQRIKDRNREIVPNIEVIEQIMREEKEMIVFQPYMKAKARFDVEHNTKAVFQIIDLAIIEEIRLEVVVLADFCFHENMVKVIADNFSTSLKTLILTNCKINNKALDLFRGSERLNTIEMLTLNDNLIDSAGTRTLSTFFCPSLKWLCLSNNRIKNKGLYYLMKGDWPKLECLSLRKCEITNDGLRNLSHANWTSLKKILCDSNNMYSHKNFAKNFGIQNPVMVAYCNWGRDKKIQANTYIVLSQP